MAGMVKEVSHVRIAICIIMYAFGVVYMMTSDCHKFYILKVKKGNLWNFYWFIKK